MKIVTMKTDLCEITRIIESEEAESIGCGILLTRDGVGLEFDGHGGYWTDDECKTGEGHRSVVWVELCNGEVVVRIWEDINDEEPTTSISLADARFGNRKD